MQPLLTALRRRLLLGERCRPAVGGLALGFAGVALVVGSKASGWAMAALGRC
jgi:drug/metabolite transporter (DMT)-like permease